MGSKKIARRASWHGYRDRAEYRMAAEIRRSHQGHPCLAEKDQLLFAAVPRRLQTAPWEIYSSRRPWGAIFKGNCQRAEILRGPRCNWTIVNFVFMMQGRIPGSMILGRLLTQQQGYGTFERDTR